MTWNSEANSIFLDAIELPSLGDRLAFIDRVCEARGELRREVMALVAAHQEAGEDGFLEHAALAEYLPLGDPLGQRETSKIKSDSPTHVPVHGQASFALLPFQPLADGTQFGRYRIERLLGRGSMGVVYLALDSRLKRHVAIKIPRHENHPELTERFEREARTMGLVSHRNLCAIHDIAEYEGVRYLSLAYIDGETLSKQLEGGERFSPFQIAQRMHKLALATHCAHRAGVVHRDLKPANIMIDQEDEPVIMDFGLAHSFEQDARLTRSGCIMGTPAYMAPEQAQGELDEVGPWSDIYSLGAILYEMLAGRPIYSGNTSRVIRQIISGETPALPSSLRSDVDARLESICMKAIAHRPQDRYASAEELATAFAEFLETPPRTDVSRGNLHVGAAQSARKFSPRIAVITAVFGFILAAAAIIVRLQTPTGALVAEINDPAMLAQVQGEILTIRDIKTKKEYQLTVRGAESKQSLPLGDYQIEIAEKESGLKLNVNSFQVTRDEREPVVKVHFEPRVREDVVKSSPAENLSPRPIEGPASKHPLVSVEYEWAPLVNLGVGINVHGPNENPAISGDGLRIIFNRFVGETLQLWEARRTSVNEAFGEASLLPTSINQARSRTDSPFLSHDGLTLWFAADRLPAGNGHDLWTSHRSSLDAPWANATRLPATINTPSFEQTPFVTSDGLTLYFSRLVNGMFKLLRATRANRSAAFEQPRILRNVNSGICSSFPCLTKDGLVLVFVHCTGRGEKLRLCYATRSSADEDFGTPQMFEPVINGLAEVSGPALSSDGKTLYFASQANSKIGEFSLWSTTRIPKR